MSIKVQWSLAIAVMFCTSLAQAKTATEVFEKVSPSVVVIRTYDAKGGGMSLGSGVVVEDGVVVTNCHVVKDAVTMLVERQNSKYPAILLQSDWDRDICSLTVDGLKGQVVNKGNTNHLKVGGKVYAVGAPKGLELTLSDGLISSLRPVEGGQYLQITAPISPGSSGGGLFDEEGQLIGLPTFYLTEGQQLNFAVPIEWVNDLSKRNTPAPKTVQTASTEWLNKAIALETKKDWPGLINHALHWTQALPKDDVAWYSLGIAYGKSKQPAKAIDAFQQALRIDPEDTEAWNNLGVTYGESNQPAKAIEAYKQAIRINPEYVLAWFNLGNAHGATNQPAKAIEAFQQAIRINPEHASAWYSLGLAYGESKQPAKAIDAFQQVLRINPEDALVWIALGGTYGLLSNQQAKAIEAFQQALRINPEDADAWYFLGIAYKLSGQASKVMEVYKGLKTLDPAMAEEFFNTYVMPQ